MRCERLNKCHSAYRRSSSMARVLHNCCMSIELNGIPAAVLMKRSGVSFFTRRVLQRWLRGEITTDAALELIGTQDAERIIDAWIQFRA